MNATAPSRPRRSRGILGLLLIGCALLCAGCTVSPGPFVSVAAQRAIGQIHLTAVPGRVLKSAAAGDAEHVAEGADPLLGAAVFVGTSALNTLQPRVIKLESDPDVTVLVVEQTIHGRSQASLFRIRTNDQLKASINGRVVEYFAPHEIVITVPRRAKAQIEISDAYAGQRIYRQGKISLRRPLTWGGVFSWLPWLHTEPAFNLDTGSAKSPPRHAEIVMTKHYSLDAVNGTTVAPWYGGDTPSEAVCESLPPQQYGHRVVQVDDKSQPPADGQWCVHTSDGRYGLLTGVIYNNDIGVPVVDSIFRWKTWTFDYLLWK